MMQSVDITISKVFNEKLYCSNKIYKKKSAALFIEDRAILWNNKYLLNKVRL